MSHLAGRAPRVLVMLALLFPVLSARPVHADAAHDQAAISAVMRSTWDRPESPLQVEPIVVVGAHAVAGWAQGDSGGRALLRRTDGKWLLHLCSGDALKETAFLVQSGLSHDDAATMARAVAAAEAALPAARVALFSRFDGVVMMDAAGNHPPAAGHGHGTGHGTGHGHKH
ncbi:MAG: copper uptake system-associated protein [Rhodospirillales bacterium]